ncbi:MAG: protein-methionine-sulfoxide reductase catalytic subunit MsrP [Planctomycetes bacterium]|nr:protein-methionine-sulfoxide reductase catalytic subunit MsrP [Planctomycetota bacterium]
MPSIHLRPPWDDPRIAPTPEHVFLNRRDWMRLAGCGTAALLFGCEKRSSAGPVLPQIADKPPPDDVRALYPAKRSAKYKVQRALTAEKVAARYNNFYEFTTDKERVADLVGSFVIRPWEVEIGGLVKKPIRIDVDDLVRKMGLEERVYRFRCVEAWAMTVPWTGFAMKKLIDHVEPLGSAKFVRFVSFHRPDQAPGQKSGPYEWPYYEALRMDEATNELAMFVTGIYGKPLPKQHGAPLRAIVPWKYGYKSPKSIVKIEFVEKQPRTFWNDLQPREYSFLSNVNPKVPHPRWSQATERLIPTGNRVPTRLHNGYADLVSHLYST